MKKRILTLIFTLILSMGVMAFAKTADNAAQVAAAEQTFVVQTVSADTEDAIPETTDFCA